MEKIIHLVRERVDRDGGEWRAEVLGSVVPALVDAGATAVSVHLADDGVGIAGPAPAPGGELPLRAAIAYWVPAHDRAERALAAAGSLGLRNDAYLVTEALWSDFGQSRGEPRGWADGERSPGLVTVALVHRNPRLDPRTFRELWYRHQSPMSERVQPRLRYVRNTVVHPVSPGAVPVDGIVVESWPSEEIVSDIEAFHLGDVGNLTIMLDSVQDCFDMDRLRSVAMSEYLFA